MSYHLAGVVSTLLYFLSVLGFWAQLQKIWERKKILGDRGATELISINFICMAFLAFFIFFFYGFALDRFNHYLVWPRLIALALSLAILYEITIDRNEWRSKAIFSSCLVITVLGITLLVFNRDLARSLEGFSQILIVLVAVLLAQGNIHQILRIHSMGDTGGVALKSHQMTLLKDLGTTSFGLAMGVTSGWPLIVLSGSNAIFKLIIMWQFRWVRVSASAKRKRERCSSEGQELSALKV